MAHAALTVGTYNIRNFDYDERARIRTDKPAAEADRVEAVLALIVSGV
jgi:hypothetical protein